MPGWVQISAPSLVNTDGQKVINTIVMYREKGGAKCDTILRYVIMPMTYPFSIANPKKQSKMGGLFMTL